MADRIIIVDIYRGKTKVPISELVQMKGRCARKHGNVGYADFIVCEDDIEELKSDLLDNNNLKVDSVLNNNLEFHLVSEIYNGLIKNISDIEKWYCRSFSNYLKKNTDIKKSIDNLLEWNCIVKRGSFIFPTNLAEIAAKLYFHPYDIYMWSNNFKEIFCNNYDDKDYAIAWALANVLKTRVNFDLGSCSEIVEEYKSYLRYCGLDYEGNIATGLCWMCLLGVYNIKSSKLSCITLKEDFGRIYKALLMLNKICGMKKDDFFDELYIRIQNKIQKNLISLFKIDGMKKIFALELYNVYGVLNYDDLMDKFDEIKKYGSKTLVRFILENFCGNR